MAAAAAVAEPGWEAADVELELALVRTIPWTSCSRDSAFEAGRLGTTMPPAEDRFTSNIPAGAKDDSAAASAIPMMPLLLPPLPLLFLGARMSAPMDKGSSPNTAFVFLASCFSRAAASCGPEV